MKMRNEATNKRTHNQQEEKQVESWRTLTIIIQPLRRFSPIRQAREFQHRFALQSRRIIRKVS